MANATCALPPRPHYRIAGKPETPICAEVRHCLNEVVDVTRTLDVVWSEYGAGIKDALILPTYQLQRLEQRMVNLLGKMGRGARNER